MARPSTACASPVAGGGMARLAIVAVILIWGLGPPVTKLISAPPLAGASMRFWMSVPVILVVTYASRRRLTWTVLRQTSIAGVLFAANLALMFATLQHASVAVLSIMLALQPGVVLVLAGPLMGERPTRWHIWWTASGVGGVVLVVLGGHPDVRGSPLGVILAAATMLTFTGYYLITRRVRFVSDADSIEWMAGVTVVAAVAILPVAIVGTSVDDFRQIGGADWLYLVFVAVMVGVVGHTLMIWAHRFVEASRSSLYLLAMHVVAIGTAWPIHDEPMTLVQGIGGAVALGAVAAVVSRPPVQRIMEPPLASGSVKATDSPAGRQAPPR